MTTTDHKKKISTLIILFGGRSVEHDASIQMYNCVMRALHDRRTRNLEMRAAYISISGFVHLWESRTGELPPMDVEKFKSLSAVSLSWFLASLNPHHSFIFSLLQGTDGEDGAFQGLFKALGFHSNAGGILGASLSMDKWAHSKMAQSIASQYISEIPTEIIRTDATPEQITAVTERFSGQACVVKPNSLGASIFCTTMDRLSTSCLQQLALEARDYTDTLLVQKRLIGAEYSFGILRINKLHLPLPAIRITSSGNFLGTKEKFTTGGFEISFIDENCETYMKMKKASMHLATAIDYGTTCRFDYIEEDGKLYLLEVNSKPGLTEDSHYTNMLRQTNRSLADLVEISMANSFFERDLKREFTLIEQPQ